MGKTGSCALNGDTPRYLPFVMSPAKPSPTPNTQIANLRFVVYGHDWRLVPSPGLSFPRDLDWVVSRGPSSPKSQGANSSVTPSLAPPPPQSRFALGPGRSARCGASPLRVLTARRGHALPRRSCFWVVTDVSTGTRTGGSSSPRSSRGDTRRPRGGQSSWEMSPSCSPGRLPLPLQRLLSPRVWSVIQAGLGQI